MQSSRVGFANRHLMYQPVSLVNPRLQATRMLRIAKVTSDAQEPSRGVPAGVHHNISSILPHLGLFRRPTNAIYIFLLPTNNPFVSATMPRAPRTLARLKCFQCRKDKQKVWIDHDSLLFSRLPLGKTECGSHPYKPLRWSQLSIMNRW